ncbi:SlyX family protein [Alphaproteobacteria bacterium]|jgi:SlyX protein|nr:SlyX family protein [Alphaproteobacteria bacterium]NCF48467.1 SlyX protein [Bacteroidota bacterium]
MEEKIRYLEEQLAIMRRELTQMSEEAYAQQKEISRLTAAFEELKNRLKSMPDDSGILKPEEDIPPPHY